MSTRCRGQRSACAGRLGPAGTADPLESIARVARARRELLLRAHRHRLPREDLEDCYSQATLELLSCARRGRRFWSEEHLANALDQRLLSRIHDCRRALQGRSPLAAALARALPLGGGEHDEPQVVDVRADVEELARLRYELRRLVELAASLTYEQRLVLSSQLAQETGCAQFCERHGWSTEKYRKVAQRARARLRDLLAEDACASPQERARPECGGRECGGRECGGPECGGPECGRGYRLAGRTARA